MNCLREYVAGLNCADEAMRIYAAEDLGYLNAPEGVPPILERLHNEPSRVVREALFQALIRIDSNTAIEGSIQLLISDDPQIRNQAVEVLRHKGAASIPFLYYAMRDGDKDVRKLVLDVLHGMEVAGAEEIYRAALSNPDPNLVITAVENLGSARAAGFRLQIEEMLQDASHPMLVGACVEALGGIGDPQSLIVIRRRFPELAAMPDVFLGSVLKATGALGTAADFAEVAGLLAVRGTHLRPAILAALLAIHQRQPAKLLAADLLHFLMSLVADGDPPLCRYQAVRTMGFLPPDDEVYTFLLSCLSSPERLVRLGAIETLQESARPGLNDVFGKHALEEADEEVRQALRC